MKKEKYHFETRPVPAVRSRLTGRMETARVLSFPVFSHPMFRAALRNNAAVQQAITEHSERVDPRALDIALESMVGELLERGGQGTTSGATAADFAVTEEEILELLEKATLAFLPTTQQQQQQTLPSPSGPHLMDTAARSQTIVQPAPALPPSLLQQHDRFVPSEAYPVSHPPLHADDDELLPPKKTQDATADAASSVPGALNVVSVDALRRAAMREVSCGESIAALDDLEAYPSSGSPPRASRLPPIPSKSGPVMVRGPKCSTRLLRRALRTEAEPRTAALYSLLPPVTTSALLAMPDRTAVSAPAALSSSHSVNPLLTFRNMDRRPGVGAGPVAQQSVDVQQLHQVPEAVFAAMDVLMDGNSCCMRRRRRPQPMNSIHGSAAYLSTTGSVEQTTAKLSAYAFGCGAKGAQLQRQYVSAPQNTFAPPPPPRSVAEAKARRILEAERRRKLKEEEKQQQQQLASVVSPHSVLCKRQADPPSQAHHVHGDALRRPLNARGDHLDSPSPSAPSCSHSGGSLQMEADATPFHASVVEVPPSTRPSVARAPTMRDVSGDSVFKLAMNSAHRYAEIWR